MQEAAAAQQSSGGGWGWGGFSNVLNVVADSVAQAAENVVDVIDGNTATETASDGGDGGSGSAFGLDRFASSLFEGTASAKPTSGGFLSDALRETKNNPTPKKTTKKDLLSSALRETKDNPTPKKATNKSGGLLSAALRETKDNPTPKKAANKSGGLLSAALRETKGNPTPKKATNKSGGLLSAALREAREDKPDAAAPPTKTADELQIEELVAEQQEQLLQTLENVGMSAFSMLKSHLKPKAGGETTAEGDSQQPMSPSGRVTFDTAFEDHTGSGHLEALKLLSNTAEARATSLLGMLQGKEKNKMVKFTLQIKKKLEIDDDNEDEDEEEPEDSIEVVVGNLKGLAVTERVKFQGLIDVFAEENKWLEEHQTPDPENADSHNHLVYIAAVSAVARVCSSFVEIMRRLAEDMLLKDKSEDAQITPEQLKKIRSQADRLRQAAEAMVRKVEVFAGKFEQTLDKSKEDADSLTTDIFIEASSASTMLQNSLVFFAPILQLSGLK